MRENGDAAPPDKTTQKFYLSVQDDDLRAARRAQQQIVKGLSTVAVGLSTDQKN